MSSRECFRRCINPSSPSIGSGASNMRFAGKVVVVTGSSRGIGRSIAAHFAHEGAFVVVNYRVSQALAEELVEKIVSQGGQAICVQADISHPDDVSRLFRAAMDAYGTVDVLVNNAGVLTAKSFGHLTSDDILHVFRVNVVGAILCAQEAAAIMTDRASGSIVNIASISGLEHYGVPGAMHYAASKAAVINMTGVLSKALAPHIRVNCVAPGFVETDMLTSPEYVEQTKDGVLKRTVTTEEVARTCLFLASDEASGMTGQTVVVDAGFLVR